jgi:hypothetical protein
MEYTNSDGTVTDEKLLIENGISSSSSQPRKGGLRTMPFIIGTVSLYSIIHLTFLIYSLPFLDSFFNLIDTHSPSIK